MNRRHTALAAMAAAIATGLAVLAVAATRPSLLAHDTTLDASSAVDAVLLTAMFTATVGVWAETRGIIPARFWLRHPARTARAIVARLTGGGQ